MLRTKKPQKKAYKPKKPSFKKAFNNKKSCVDNC